MLCDNDVIVIHFQTATKRVLARNVTGITDWPPPEMISIGGFKFKRTRYSKLTDEVARSTIYIARGAEYEPT